jgi:transcriptional regulator with XRE-family HTH domain
MEKWSEMLKRHAEEKNAFFDRIALMDKTAKEIIDEHGISQSKLYAEMRKRDLKIPYGVRGPKGVKTIEYFKCAAKGMTMQQTAKHLGVSASNVCQIAEKHGIPFVKKQGYQKP